MWAAFDAGDAEAFAAAVTPDWCERDGEGEIATVSVALEAIDRYRNAFQGTSTALDQIVAEGDLVAVRTTTVTTHRATGKILRRHEVAIHRVESGRVAQTWSQGGTPSFDEQVDT